MCPALSERILIVAEKQGPHGLLLVITDKDLLGKKITAGKIQLDLSAKFYQGTEQTKEEVKKQLVRARDLHFSGKEAVALGVEEDLINPHKILWVKGVPHAEVVMG